MKKLTLLLVLFAYLFVLMPGTASAESVLDQAYELNAPNVSNFFYSDWLRAQTFTAGVSGTLTAVNLAIASEVVPSHYMRVAIHDVVGDYPSATELAFTLVAPENQSSSWQTFFAYDITFSPGVEISAGTKYAIVVSYENAPLTRVGTWPSQTSPGYPGGDHYYDVGSGWVIVPGEIFGDTGFRTYAEPSFPLYLPSIISQD